MEKINVIQQIQDDEYFFPYHYIPEYEKHFTLSKSWSWGMQYISTIEFVLNEVSSISFNSLCDVGTGDGRLVKELTKKFPHKKIVGIDYSEKAINLAKALNPTLHFECVNILENSYKQKYDILTLIEVFEHIPIDLCENFVKSLSNILEENGKLIITVPHINKKKNEKHFQHFDEQKIKKYFSKDFMIEEIIYFEDMRRSMLKKVIQLVIYNRMFILNNSHLLNYFYSVYKKKYFFSDKENCGRIFVKMSKK